MKHPPTHRCKGSLAAHIPIRYVPMFDWLKYENDEKVWRLFMTREDDEVIGCVHVVHVAAITYCPFCGVELGVKHGEGA